MFDNECGVVVGKTIHLYEQGHHDHVLVFNARCACRPKPAVISRTLTLASRSGSASPRRDFFVPYRSHCLQKGLTNQNPLTAHIFIGLRGP